jgi:hypothetical protein
LVWGFATASALPLFPAGLSLIWPALFLPRIGRPVLMLAAAPIVWLRPCCGSARNQYGDNGRNKKRFHKITRSAMEGRRAAGCHLVWPSDRKRANGIFAHLIRRGVAFGKRPQTTARRFSTSTAPGAPHAISSACACQE